MHFVGKRDAVPENVEGYKAGDVILVGYDEYVCDGNTWLPLGNESIYQTKEQAGKDHEAINGVIAALEKKHDDEMDALELDHTNRLNALDKKYGDIIDGLDYNDAAVAGQFITEVKQADGAIEVKRAALTAADIPELAQSKITGLEKALQDLNQAVTDAESGALEDAKKYADDQILAKVESLDKADTAVEKQFVTAVSEADGIITVSRAALKATDIPVIEQTQVNGLGDALAAAAKAGTDAAAQALADAKADAQARIEALDSSIAEEADKVISGFAIADGVITPDSVKKVTLAKIATTGNVNDLIQTAGDVLIFNCGSSSEVF